MKKETFPKIKGRVIFGEELSKHTTLRAGGPSRVWVEPRDESELRKILEFAKRTKKIFFIIGFGSNTLFRDKEFKGIVIKLGKGFKSLCFSGSKVTAGAAAALSVLIDTSCKKGIGGMESLAGIPGTVGGAIFMNAGSYGWNISDFLTTIRVMEIATGKITHLRKDDIRFGYRYSGLKKYIILGAEFSLKKRQVQQLVNRKTKFLALKRKHQPLREHSAGCVFKNPGGKKTAAEYIESLGLGGKRFGKAEISKKHANFIVTKIGVKSGDIMRLMDFVKKNVKTHFKVDLVPEIKIL